MGSLFDDTEWPQAVLDQEKVWEPLLSCI